MRNKRYKEVSSLQNIYLYQINVKLFQDPEIIYVTRSNSFLLKQCFLSIEIKQIFCLHNQNFPKIQSSNLHQQNSQNNVKILFT